MNITYLFIGAIIKSEVLYNFFYFLVLFLNGAFKFETGGKSECFTDGETGEEDVILHDIGSISRKSFLVNWYFVIE